ncbi:MAG: hypothetical protein KatS3mg101_0023 [Patescibacteria group bacterium]|nr:MAG: hypothetical protein KatS3mg101_0023 [Patescibacteria group bacterium]
MHDHDHERPPMPPKHNEIGAFMKGAFWGALVGAVLGILLAPDSGEKTRKKIKEKSDEFAEKGREALEELAEKTEKIKEQIEPYKEEAEELFKTAGEKVREETDNLKRRYFKGIK